MRRVHEAHTGGTPLAEGYAPFCKHVFVPNFTGAQLSTLRITKDNEHLLRSGCARLPVASATRTANPQAHSPTAPPARVIITASGSIHARPSTTRERFELEVRVPRSSGGPRRPALPCAAPVDADGLTCRAGTSRARRQSCRSSHDGSRCERSLTPCMETESASNTL